MRRLATRNPYGTRVFPSMHSGWLYTHASSCEHLYGWNVCLGYGCSVLPERLFPSARPGYEHMCGLGELIMVLGEWVGGCCAMGHGMHGCLRPQSFWGLGRMYVGGPWHMSMRRWSRRTGRTSMP